MVYCPTVSSGWFYVRRNGKIYVTGNTNYLGQPRTMAAHTKVPSDQIQQFQNNYFEAFPCVSAWQQETIRLLKSTGTLTHLWGRRRSFFGRHTDQPVINAAIAYCPQGMTGDQINEGILQLDQHPAFELLVQVHDSILMQVPTERLDELVPVALDLMKSTRTLKGGREFFVPLEAKVGWNWGDSYGKVNPFGLMKFKGTESRIPPVYKKRPALSMKAFR